MKNQFRQYCTSEVVFYDIRAPIGMFTYRLLNARSFIDPRNEKHNASKKEHLDAEIALNKPKSSLALFLIIVAFEDYIRDFLDGFSRISGINNYYFNASGLRLRPKKNPSKGMSDSFHLSAVDINKKLKTYFNFEVTSSTDECNKLDDLIVIRHIVAHFGSFVDSFNQTRFKYYDIGTDQILNPTLDQVHEIFDFFWALVAKIEDGVRDDIFIKIKTRHPDDWKNQEITAELLKHFSMFRKLISEDTGKTREVVLAECYELIEQI